MSWAAALLRSALPWGGMLVRRLWRPLLSWSSSLRHVLCDYSSHTPTTQTTHQLHTLTDITRRAAALHCGTLSLGGECVRLWRPLLLWKGLLQCNLRTSAHGLTEVPNWSRFKMTCHTPSPSLLLRPRAATTVVIPAASPRCLAGELTTTTRTTTMIDDDPPQRRMLG